MSGRENRRSPRVAHSDQLIIKVISSSSSALMEGRTLYCCVENASQDGLCINVTEPVHRGTAIELWVIAKHRPGTLVLAGEIIWCKEVSVDPSGQVGYACGIQFFMEPPDAIHEWRETLAELIVDSRRA